MAKNTERDRGQIIEKGDRKYLIRIYLGKDAKGKRKYSSETFNGLRRDAEKRLTAMLRESDTHMYAGPTNITVEEFFLGTPRPTPSNPEAREGGWLEGRTDISAYTLAGYKQRMVSDILPHIGGWKLEKLTPQTIQAAFNKVATGALSPRTIHYDRMILKQALEQALDWGLIHKNPARKITVPKMVKREMTTLTPSQAEQLIEWANENQQDFVALWVVLLTTGLRPQEALALKWDDLTEATDETGARYPVFQIKRALIKVSGSVYKIGSTKTEKSTRQVSLDDDTLRFLAEHKRRQATEALSKGARYDRQGWVFANHVGGYWDISKVRKSWYKATEGAKIPDVRLYDSRHTHATILLGKGIHPKVVADRMGHSTTRLTLDTYSHVIKEVAKDAGKTAAGAIFGSQKRAQVK